VPSSLTREPACPDCGQLTLVALVLGMRRSWHLDRTGQPNEKREGGTA